MQAERIGIAAGAVWTRLKNAADKNAEGRGTTLVDLKKIAGFTPDEVMAGLGWLAREGKIEFETLKDKKLIVRLAGAEMFV